MATFNLTRISAFPGAPLHVQTVPTVSDEAKLAILADALRDASGWLESVANFCGLPSVREAAGRARAALEGVSHE